MWGMGERERVSGVVGEGMGRKERGERKEREKNRETCVLMWQFRKYMVFGTQLYEI